MATNIISLLLFLIFDNLSNTQSLNTYQKYYTILNLIWELKMMSNIENIFV